MEILKTKRLILRRLILNDIEDVFHYSSNREVTKFVTWEAHQTFDDTLNFLQYLFKQYQNGQTGQWGIEFQETGKIIGAIDFVSMKAESTIGEVGYILSEDYWGQGIMTEALQEVMRYGFKTMNLKRIEAKCVANNKASSRVLEKANMRLEGTSRQSFLMKGNYHDVKHFSILKEEFKEK